MKTHCKTFLSSRSLLALGLGCALATLPFGATYAQDEPAAQKPAAEDAAPLAPTSPAAAPMTEAPAAKADAPTKADKKAAKAAKTDEAASDGTKLKVKEKMFVHMAGAANAAEVKLAELALTNGEAQTTKDFANMMIKDHTAANEDLAKVAASHNLTDFKPEPNAKQKATYAEFEKLKGAAFDAAYAKQGVKDHAMVLAEYKKAGAMTKDAELKAYIDKVTPTVAEHLKMAKDAAPAKGKAKKM